MARKRARRCAKIVVGQCHSAFACGDDLHRVKAEYRDVAMSTISDRMRALARLLLWRGGIFNDTTPVLPCQLTDSFHVAGLAREWTGIITFASNGWRGRG